MRISRLLSTALTSLLFFTPCAAAHELQENRATLVLRDRNYLSLTLFISYAEALHLALAPQRSMQEFLLVYSTLKPEDLEKELSRAQAGFQSRTRLILNGGSEAQPRNWTWPEANKVQALLQRLVMQAVVGDAGHSHAEPLEIRADVISDREISSVQVQFPDEFRKVLVVAFRPSQMWVESKALSPEIRF